MQLSVLVKPLLLFLQSLIENPTMKQSIYSNEWNECLWKNGCNQLFVGNKSDLEERRKVSKDEAQLFCNRKGIDYIETSAKSDEHVHEVFEHVIRIVRDAEKRGSGGDDDTTCTIM
eukprot:m.158285 g.158285  ORF g.158285 m.158285 type:complete len:116 (+) comp13351_c6_seq2:3356-3703(+)